VECKPYTTTITTPTGWTKIGEATNGTVANAADLGSTKIAMYVRENAPVGAIPAITMATADTACAVIHSYSKDASDDWDYSVFTTGGDTTNGTNYSATGSAIATASGDMVIAATAVNSDLGTVSAQAIGGMSGSTLSQNVRTAGVTGTGTGLVTTGNDSRLIVVDALITAGSSAAAPTFTYTNASSTSGTTLWLRLREAASVSSTLGSETWPGSGAIPTQWVTVNSATTSQGSSRGSVAPSASTTYRSAAIYMYGATARADWQVSTDIVPVSGNVEHYPGLGMAQTPATAGTSSSTPDRGYAVILQPFGSLVEVFASTAGTQFSLGSFAYTFTSAAKVSIVFQKSGTTLSVWVWDTVAGSRSNYPNWTTTDTSFTTTALKPMLVVSNGGTATIRTVTFGPVTYTDVPPVVPATVTMTGAGSLTLNFPKLTFQSVAAADTLATDVPTVTQTQQATTTIASGTLVAPSDSRIHYRGGGGFGFGTGFPLTTVYAPNSLYPNTFASPQQWSVTFQHTGTTFETMHYLASLSGSWRIKVNGQRVTDLPNVVSGLTNGSRYVRKFVFGSSATRIITLETAYHHFGGVFVNTATDTIAAAPAFNVRAIFEGDSITGGSSQNTGLSNGTYPHRLADYIGVDDPWNAALGATGYVDPGALVKLNDRLADVTSWAPDVVVVWAGYNDIGETAGTVQAAATTYLTNIKAALPGAEMYVVGCWVPIATPSAGMILVDNEVEAAALAVGVPFISPLTGDVLDATGTLLGNTGEWIATSGDVTAYIGADNVHPNNAGHVRIATMMREALMLANGISSSTEVTATVPMSGAGTLSVTTTRVVLPSVTMSGTGTFTVTPLVTHPYSVPMAGAGTLTITAFKTVPATVPMSGAGSLTVTAAVSQPATVSMAGAGTLSLAGTQTIPATVALTGTGTLTVTPTTASTATLSMVGAGVLSVTTSRTVFATVPMSGAGTLSVTGSGTLFTGSVPMAGAGTLSLTAVVAQAGTVSMAGAGTLSITAVTAGSGAVAMAGAGTLTVTPVFVQFATLTLTGAGTLAVSGAKSTTATVPMAGAGTLSITALAAHFATVPMAASGSMTITATVQQSVLLAMAGSGTLSVAATLVRTGVLTLAGTGTLTVVPSGEALTSVTMAGAGTLTISVTTSRTGVLTMAGQGTLTVSGPSGISGTVPMTGQGTLALSGIKIISGTVPMLGTGGLDVASTGGAQGAPIMAGAGTLTVYAAQTVFATVAMAGQNTLTLTATKVITATVSLTGVGTLTVEAASASNTTVTMAGQTVLAITPVVVHAVSLTLSGQSALSITPTVVYTVALTLAGQGNLSVTAVVVHAAPVPMGGTGSFTVFSATVVRTTVLSFAGVGTMTTAVTTASVLALAGHGTLTITAATARPAVVGMAGFSSMLVAPRVIVQHLILMFGNGSLQVTASTRPTGQLLFTGIGVLQIFVATGPQTVVLMSGFGTMVIVPDALTREHGHITVGRPRRGNPLTGGPSTGRISIGGPRRHLSVTGPR
jgi:lysophospholipase L1-like esterase